MSIIGRAKSPIRRGQVSRDPLSWGWRVCGLFVVGAFLGCQTPDATVDADELNTAAPAATAPGAIVLESAVFDFGDVSPSAKPEGFFEFKNEGQGPLRITRVQGCCGAVVKLSKGGVAVDAKNGLDMAPGEGGRLDVTYSPSYVGPWEKKIHLFTDDPGNKIVVLTIKGQVVRKLSWTPARVKLFLDKENAGCRAITVKSLDGKPFALKSFRVTGNCMTLGVDPNLEATEFTLQPQIAMDVLSAMVMPKGRITIEHTHPGCDAISLNFDLLPRYSHKPGQYILFSVDPSQTVKRQLLVHDNYAEDQLIAKGDAAINSVNATPVPPTFEIESVTSEKGTAVLTKTELVNNGYMFHFDITPPPPADNGSRFQDSILVRIKGGMEERVAIQGYYSQKVRDAAAALRQSVSQIPK